MLTEDLHTHTFYSHGRGTIEENVQAAIRQGLKRIGIAEHGPGHIFFPVKYKTLLRIRKEIDEIKTRYGGQIEILMGLEANLMGDGVTDVPEDTSIFDFLMLGYHKGTAPCDSISRGWMKGLLLRQSDRHGRANAEAYIRAMDTMPKLINITHPGTYIPVDIPLLAREAAARGITLEINESHHNMNISELQAARAEGAVFYLSSDAHKPRKVGMVEESTALARQAGILPYVKNWSEPPA